MSKMKYYEKISKKKLPRAIYDYYAAWAGDGLTLLQNRKALDNCQLVPRVLNGVSEINTSVNIFGTHSIAPIIVAPTSFHQMADPNGEIATANGAKNADVIMIASLLSNKSLEDISSTGANLWFQLYILNDREFTIDIIRRVEAANFKALVITVDSHIIGIRNDYPTKPFVLPKKFPLPNFDNMKFFQEQFNSVNLFYKKISWKDIDWLRTITKLPIILKGVLHPEDAMIAIDHSVNGIVISNHGGRQLDTAVAALTILPKIVNSAAGKLKLFIDGSIQRGTDVVKAICLGADAVLIGRPIIWGLTARGESGVLDVLNILKNELNVTMALCGYSSIQELAEAGSNIIL
jgi:isopentenyl diphosphate isomerase/L-lactate dehydrogenase-like FMN-dependent dehydrogenase